MQGAGCSEVEGEQDLTEAWNMRERRKDCMHFVEMLSKKVEQKEISVHNLFT